jgi:hypothetical protein
VHGEYDEAGGGGLPASTHISCRPLKRYVS